MYKNSYSKCYAYYYSLRLDALEYVRTGDIHPSLKFEIGQLYYKKELKNVDDVVEFILNESLALSYYEKIING